MAETVLEGMDIPPHNDKSIEERRRHSRDRRDDRSDDRTQRRDHHGRDRDRDRSYKRKKSPSPSPSPPPPPHTRDRGRRHSPPQKRFRRHNDYQGRRGSPRHGYDSMRSYDRGGMGPRAGYGSQRSHGRHVSSRSSGAHQDGPHDWSGHGHTGFNDGPFVMGAIRGEGLMTYKQFITEVEDDISPAEAQHRYEEYKTEYIATQKNAFFEAHKDEEWLRDKYDPSRLEDVIQRRNENAKASAKEFQQDFQNGTLDTGPSAAGALSPSAKRGQDIDHTSEDDADATGRSRKHGKNYARENELCCAAPKAPLVCSEPRRVLKDIDQGFALIRKLDTEKGIEENILVTSEQDKMDGELRVSMGPTVTVRGANTVKGLEDLELLDVLITYLWRVHAIDYYGMIELKEFPKGLRHIRVEGKNNIEEQSTKSAEWEKKLDMTWQIRLQGEDPLELLLAKEKLEIAATEALDPYIRKIRDEKYGCGAKGCTKLFHAPEFVRKHLRLKHAELVADSISKAREEIYYQNYMNDSNAPGVSVTTQQHGQGDRIWRNKARLGIATEATYHDRDIDHHDSSSGRENDRVDSLHEEDQYDRSEDSLSRDYPLIPGGPAYDSADAGHSDPSMFDHFTGSAPFGSDMACPPPVLMPVPGAGPLGPFVPAPPEVAMRMMSEQSGSTPLHSGEKKGGPPGQKGCSSGHSMGGMMDPSANLPMAPALRQDPRHLRNYNDLDVPEDEVTVIDYRSL